jgi:hypothetical protein
MEPQQTDVHRAPRSAVGIHDEVAPTGVALAMEDECIAQLDLPAHPTVAVGEMKASHMPPVASRANLA